MRETNEMLAFVEHLADGEDATRDVLRAAVAVTAIGTTLLISAAESEDGVAAQESGEASAVTALVAMRKAVVELLNDGERLETEQLMLETVALWRSIMTVVRDATLSGPSASIGVALAGAGLQATLLIMADRVPDPAATVTDAAGDVVRDTRGILGAVYESSGLVDMMKASARHLRLRHGSSGSA